MAVSLLTQCCSKSLIEDVAALPIPQLIGLVHADGVKSECFTSPILWSYGNIFFCSGHSQILSHSSGCEIKSGSGLGMWLRYKYTTHTHTRKMQATMTRTERKGYALNSIRWHPGLRVNNCCILPAGSLAQQYCPSVPVY